VDNGSTDDTAAIVRQTQDERRQQIHYCFEETPGLHVGRHRGTLEARGEILTFVDDDVTLFPGWLQSIADAFTRTECHRILPDFAGMEKQHYQKRSKPKAIGPFTCQKHL